MTIIKYVCDCQFPTEEQCWIQFCQGIYPHLRKAHQSCIRLEYLLSKIVHRLYPTWVILCLCRLWTQLNQQSPLLLNWLLRYVHLRALSMTFHDHPFLHDVLTFTHLNTQIEFHRSKFLSLWLFFSLKKEILPIRRINDRYHSRLLMSILFWDLSEFMLPPSVLILQRHLIENVSAFPTLSKGLNK